MKNKVASKLIIVCLLGLAFAVFFYFDIHKELSFENIGNLKAQFGLAYEQNQALFLGGYFLAYVLVTAFSLPGAAIMTLAGGAMFGFWPTLITVSFASTIGATLACLFSRYVLGNWVQEKFGDKIKPINQGIEQDGAFYLFTLRLIPAFPFFVINLVMGLTKIPLITYYWVSQLGMLPGTAVFVNAGTQLAKIQSPGDILTPGLLLSFAALGLLPLVLKLIMNFVMKKRRQRQAA